MKKNYSHIILIGDQSGSMQNNADATINGINEVLETHRKAPGTATVTLVLFNEDVKAIHEHINIQDVPNLTRETYVANGFTALYDAIGMTIDREGEWLASLPGTERPEKVFLVITTDGFENRSRVYTDPIRINAMITHQQEKYSWEPIFLGANQDAIVTAVTLGIQPQSAMTFAANPVGTSCMYTSVGKAMLRSRSGGASARAAFTPEDYKLQKQAGVEQ